MTTQALATTQNQQLAVPSVAMMLQGVIDKGITAENVSALEQLVGLYERMQAKSAAIEFAEAFRALQRDIPNIKAIRPVVDKHGVTKYKIAPFEDIMEQARKPLDTHGFTVSFSSDIAEGGRIVKTCILQHTSGHKKENTYAVRIGGGPPGATESQADGSAHSYAKRGALCDALNIVIERLGDEAGEEGAPITQQQADNLRDRVRATGSDEVRFLAFAQAKTFEDIMDTRFDALDEFLHRKEMQNAKPIPKKEDREPGETGADLF